MEGTKTGGTQLRWPQASPGLDSRNRLDERQGQIYYQNNQIEYDIDNQTLQPGGKMNEQRSPTAPITVSAIRITASACPPF